MSYRIARGTAATTITALLGAGLTGVATPAPDGPLAAMAEELHEHVAQVWPPGQERSGPESTSATTSCC